MPLVTLLDYFVKRIASKYNFTDLSSTATRPPSVYYLFAAMLVLHPWFFRRTNSSSLLAIVILLYSMFLALQSSELGADFRNYEQFIMNGTEGKIGDNEVLFINLLDFLRQYDLSARSISVLNISIYLLVILISPKSLRSVVSNIIISIFLVVSVFNGLRLGLAISTSLLLYMILLRLRYVVGHIFLLPLSAVIHASLSFPVIIYLTLWDNIPFKKIAPFIIFGLFLMLGRSRLEFLDFPLEKIASYFEYGNDQIGGLSLTVGCGLMIYGWRSSFSEEQIGIFLLITTILLIMSITSYLGIRLLGILPIAFYMLLFNRQYDPKGGLYTDDGMEVPISLRLSFFVFSTINVKNILFGYEDNYIF